VGRPAGQCCQSARNAVIQRDKTFVHGAVVAPVKNQNLGALHICRASRMERLASVAVTRIARADRSAAVIPPRQKSRLRQHGDPRFICSSTTFTVAKVNVGHGAGIAQAEIDVTKPVHMQNCAPWASRTNGRKAPAHSIIQFMGTPRALIYRHARTSHGFRLSLASACSLHEGT
jgi:hypothetical protein